MSGPGPYNQDQKFDYTVDFVTNRNQHATAVPERWSVEGGGWGPNPRTLNTNSQNFAGVRPPLPSTLRSLQCFS